MMSAVSYLGNQSLLSLPKTAFLASNTIPLEMVLRCYDWAVMMRNVGHCVVSGFSSRLEQDVWDFLVSGTQPIILVLARGMYRRVPPPLDPLLTAGRLLVISTTMSPRQSRATAFARNKYICELADEILFIGANEGSSLHPLQVAYSKKAIAW